MKARITYKQLESLNACSDQLAKFKELFGDEIVVTIARAKKYSEYFDWSWIVNKTLSAPLLAEYEKAHAPLWEKYKKACTYLWAEYEKARAPLLAEYKKARASLWAKLYIKQQRNIKEAI
jgi:hypothetical protein